MSTNKVLSLTAFLTTFNTCPFFSFSPGLAQLRALGVPVFGCYFLVRPKK